MSCNDNGLLKHHLNHPLAKKWRFLTERASIFQT